MVLLLSLLCSTMAFSVIHQGVWVMGVGRGRRDTPRCLTPPLLTLPFSQYVPLPWPTHAAGSVTLSPLAEEWGYLSLGWEILILPC